jgi:hypothetical protein
MTMSKEFKVKLTKGEIDCLLEAIEFVGEVAYDDEANYNELEKVSNKLFKLIDKG